MLVVTRQEDDAVVVGTGQTAYAELTLAEIECLRQCRDPQMIDICRRMLASMSKPIEFRIVEIHGKQVRVGITAPRNIPVNRLEVYNQIRRLSLATTP